jgi:uncharacterized protein YbjQ (UPF0145 family)
MGIVALVVAAQLRIIVCPERVEVLPFDARDRENALPGMVERTVYVGANLQVMVRLATGQVVQAQIINTGDTANYRQGTAVLIHVPPEALRVLAAPGRVGVEPLEEAPPAEAVAARGA